MSLMIQLRDFRGDQQVHCGNDQKGKDDGKQRVDQHEHFGHVEELLECDALRKRDVCLAFEALQAGSGEQMRIECDRERYENDKGYLQSQIAVLCFPAHSLEGKEDENKAYDTKHSNKASIQKKDKKPRLSYYC